MAKRRSQSGTERIRNVVNLFGATSSPSIANYALRRCAEVNQAVFSPYAITSVLKIFYVDDCLKSVSQNEQEMTHIQDLRSLCAGGDFQAL